MIFASRLDPPWIVRGKTKRQEHFAHHSIGKGLRSTMHGGDEGLMRKMSEVMDELRLDRHRMLQAAGLPSEGRLAEQMMAKDMQKATWLSGFRLSARWWSLQ